MTILNVVGRGFLIRHGRGRDGNEAIDLLSVCSRFWVDLSSFVRFGASTWLKNVLATAMIVLRQPPPGHAVLWSVGVGAAVIPVA